MPFNGLRQKDAVEKSMYECCDIDLKTAKDVVDGILDGTL